MTNLTNFICYVLPSGNREGTRTAVQARTHEDALNLVTEGEGELAYLVRVETEYDPEYPDLELEIVDYSPDGDGYGLRTLE